LKNKKRDGKFAALMKLTRIEHSIMLVIAVIAAELETAGLLGIQILWMSEQYKILFSLITPIFLSMASFAINDYFDVETDRANKRFDRPLVSGALGRQTALNVALSTFILGVAVSYFINLSAFVLAIIFGVLAFLYSYRLKDTLLVGNVYIALSMVIAFIYGDFVVSGNFNLVPSIVIISMIIFLSGLAREIHGMIRDFRGDARVRQMKGLVHYIGIRKSALISLVLYGEAVAISIFVFFFYAPFLYNIFYIIPILVTDLALMYIALGYMVHLDGSKSDTRFFDMARNISLGAMALALLAFLIAPLTAAV
jgi:geranylgeranylglycerol-phosphate geranylgeranyltransferase